MLNKVLQCRESFLEILASQIFYFNLYPLNNVTKVMQGDFRAFLTVPCLLSTNICRTSGVRLNIFFFFIKEERTTKCFNIKFYL